MEQWHAAGSGWIVEKIELFYVKIVLYDPLRVGTYLPLPSKLANKNAIINVKNRDNECLKWSLRAALFPAPEEKNQNRPTSYPTNDRINYEGMDFPTPVNQIDKLEAQNINLAINVFGWKDDHVEIHRVSERREEKNVKQINLMLIESEMKQHYCYVSVSNYRGSRVESKMSRVEANMSRVEGNLKYILK